MQNLKPISQTRLHGFTLMETVIAIGVLAVLLTGFLAVFTPATQGIRQSLNSQQADRFASVFETELTTLRDDQEPRNATSGFEKAFDWIKNSGQSANSIFVYQYRGEPSNLRNDGTPTPVPDAIQLAGRDYVLQPMARRLNDDNFAADMAAIEGPVYFVKTTQLFHNKQNNELELKQPGEVFYVDPDGNEKKADEPADFMEGVITFTAGFHSLPTKSITYMRSPKFDDYFDNANKPVFKRNMGVSR